MTPYVEPVAFTALFKARRRNHAAICTGLSLIATGVARTFRFDDGHDQADAAAEATAHSIARIGTFNRGRPGANAFRFFTTVAMNSIRGQLRAERSRVRILEPVDVYQL